MHPARSAFEVNGLCTRAGGMQSFQAVGGLLRVTGALTITVMPMSACGRCS